MYSDGFNPKLLKWCSWTGAIFFVMWLVGAGPTTGWLYLPPPSAADAAAMTAADYTRSLAATRIGITLCNFSCIFYLTWGVVVSFMVRRVEGEYPVLFYIQMVSLAACVVVILFLAFFWGAAAWRAGETGVEITQVMNDLGWLGVLYTGAPFASYQIALGVTTLIDKSDHPVYPRWSAFLNFFVSVFMFEAAGIIFFKSGPFSQNGLLVFYAPMICFFAWVLVFSFLSIRAINAEVQRRDQSLRRNASEPQGSQTAVASARS